MSDEKHGERIASLETDVSTLKVEVSNLRVVSHKTNNELQKQGAIYAMLIDTVTELKSASQGLSASVNKLVNIKYMVVGGFVVGKSTIFALGGKILGWW
jgi:phage-related protein